MHKEGVFRLLQEKVNELNCRGFNFELDKPLLEHGQLIIKIKGRVAISVAICNQGDIFCLKEGQKKLHFLKEDLVNYLLLEANGGATLGKLMPGDWPQSHFKHLEGLLIT